MRGFDRRVRGGAILAAATVLVAAAAAWGDDERTRWACACRLGAAEVRYYDRTCETSDAGARDSCRQRCERRLEGWWPGCGDCLVVDTGTPCRD